MAITDNLSFFLDCEESSSTRVDSHAARNFTPSGSLSNTTGVVGNGATWPSLSGVVLGRNSEAALQPGPDFTYQCWFNGIGSNMDQYAQLGGKDDANSTRQWAVYLKGDTNEFAVLAVDSASGLYFNAGAGSWTDSTTYHLIVTYGSTDKIMRLYKNTVLQITSDPLTNGINTIASWPFEIGARSIVSAARFSGMLDLIGYWQRVLTTAEIIRLYNSGYGLSYAQMIVTPSSLGSSLFSAGRPHGLGGGSDERRWF